MDRDRRSPAARTTGRREASLLIVVDQFEELLVAANDVTSTAFLRMLNAVAERQDAPVIVVATLRSDFLGAFQSHPALLGLNYEPLPLPPLAPADLMQVIEGPARLAGIELEPGVASNGNRYGERERVTPARVRAARDVGSLRRKRVVHTR